MLLKNAWTINEQGRLTQQDWGVAQGRLTRTDHACDEVFDCSDYLVLPGLVNAHFHGTSTITRGLFMDMPVADWLNDSPQGQIQRRYVQAMEQLSFEERMQISLYEYLQMIRQGVTTVFDCRLFRQDEQAKLAAAAQAGIRLTLETDEPHPEWESERCKTALPLPEESSWSEAAAAEVLKWKQEYPQLLCKAHCMETALAAERIKKLGYSDTVSAYKQAGLLDSQTVLIHGCRLTDSALKEAAACGVRMINCPISNLKSLNGVSPLKNMLKQGIEIGLGTDWGRSSIFDVMKAEYLLLRHAHVEQAAMQVWQMVTSWGARCCGWKDIGCLEAGNRADLIFLDLNNPDFQPLISQEGLSTVIQNWVFDGQPQWVRHVMIEGVWQLFDGQLVCPEASAVFKKQGELQRRLARIAGGNDGTLS